MDADFLFNSGDGQITVYVPHLHDNFTIVFLGYMLIHGRDTIEQKV
uniref:Uncharacterized protein n=1 Tax=Rhizophora mucronata TaxID=61149 RepID=A0A2P2QFD5_RHIMU